MAIRLILAALFVSGTIAWCPHATAQSRTVFSGIPEVKVTEVGVERTAEQLSRDKAANLGCVISAISGKYYWATRENKEMIRRSSGGFITFVAVDGSGYVRVIDAAAKPAASQMSPTEAQFDYVEHLVIGLRTISYFGRSR